MAVESSFNPFAQSPVGAQGLMQVMTHVHGDKYESFGGKLAAFDPVTNLRVGVKVLKECIAARRLPRRRPALLRRRRQPGRRRRLRRQGAGRAERLRQVVAGRAPPVDRRRAAARAATAAAARGGARQAAKPTAQSVALLSDLLGLLPRRRPAPSATLGRHATGDRRSPFQVHWR